MMNILPYLPPPQEKNTYCSVDTEWFRMNKNLIHRPYLNNGKFACLTLCSEADPENVYLIESPELVPAVLDIIKDCIWVIQRAKFDLSHLRRLATITPRKRLWDTEIIEQIMFGGYYEAFSLKALARRYLSINLSKEAREKFEDADELTNELREYACLDPYYTLRVCQEQRKIISKNDMQIWHEIERPALFAYMDFKGFRIDVDKWEQLAKENKIRGDEVAAQLKFNPKAAGQTLEALRKAGWSRLKNTVEKTITKELVRHPEKPAAQLARTVLEARKYYKRSSTYGLNFVKNYVEDEEDYKVVFGNYNPIGTETGGSSCTDPNLQNVPVRDTKDFRKCFIARPKHKLIVLDWSQQEPCIAAYLSQDPLLLKATQGNDIYIETAKIRFGEDITKNDPRRKQMKAVFLGLDYGLSEFGLAEKEGILVEDAIAIIDQFFKTFKVLKRWMDKQKKEKNCVRTVCGRKVYLNPYNSQCERNALNAPIQGTARGDMKKKALGRIHSQWNFDVPYCVVADIHDEIVLDAPEENAEEIAEWCADIMVKTAEEICPDIKFKVGKSIGVSWADKE